MLELAPPPGDVAAPVWPEQEDYLSRAQLAKRMGVSVATVDRWVAAGMPSETWGLRARRFRPSTSIAWVRAQKGTGRT